MYLKQILFLISNSGHWILEEVCLDCIFVEFLFCQLVSYCLIRFSVQTIQNHTQQCRLVNALTGQVKDFAKNKRLFFFPDILSIFFHFHFRSSLFLHFPISQVSHLLFYMLCCSERDCSCVGLMKKNWIFFSLTDLRNCLQDYVILQLNFIFLL